MTDSPRFLRKPDSPSFIPRPERPISAAELVELWSKTGVIRHYKPARRWTRADFLGVLSAVAALAFSLGYYLAS